MDNPGDSNGQLLPWVKRTIKKLATAPSIPHLPHQQSSRRQLSLIVINASLNVLLWASVFCVMVAIYLIGADPGDNTNIPTVILTLTSSIASIAYTVLHTIFSLKQRIWRHQRAHPSIIQKTTYIAIRFSVTLCVLWLLTAGWDLILVARRPICLPEDKDISGWEAGTPCVIGRVGVAMSIISLMVSCALFGILAVVRRPFEAHLLRYRYEAPTNPTPSSGLSQKYSRNASMASEKYHPRRISASTRRSIISTHSNTDVDTIDLNSNSPPASILSPSPVRSIGIGVFTSQEQPPPFPSSIAPSRASSFIETAPPIFQPTALLHSLPPPPRMSSLITPSGFVPLSVPASYSASTWRAIHPPAPSYLGSAASRSHPHLPNTIYHPPSLSHLNRYSRSQVSLTRPQRLSTATPTSVAWSSQSGSTGGDEGRGSPSSAVGASNSTFTNDSATANAIAYAILNGTPMPRSLLYDKGQTKHIRHSSAPDATAGAANASASMNTTRKAKGWKPRLRGQQEIFEGQQPIQNLRTGSADLTTLLKNAENVNTNVFGFEKELDLRTRLGKGLPFRKTRSMSPLRQEESLQSNDEKRAKTATTVTASATLTTATTAGIRIPTGSGSNNVETGVQTTTSRRDIVATRPRRMTYEEVKNKPLPKIAVL